MSRAYNGSRSFSGAPPIMGVVTGRLLENRQWERTLFTALQVYRVKMTSGSDPV
jgi:hypothetical protein